MALSRLARIWISTKAGLEKRVVVGYWSAHERPEKCVTRFCAHHLGCKKQFAAGFVMNQGAHRKGHTGRRERGRKEEGTGPQGMEASG